MRWIINNDETTVKTLAASGELTMSSQFQSPDTYHALVDMGRFRLESQPTTTAFYLKLNSAVAPTDDVHIRRAIAAATDYTTIHEVIFPGEPMTTVLPSGFADFWNADVAAPVFGMSVVLFHHRVGCAGRSCTHGAGATGQRRTSGRSAGIAGP